MMKKGILIIGWLIGTGDCLFAQTAPGIEWQNTIGGSDIDALNAIQQTFDGGYILAGSSTSPISGDKTEDSYGDDDYWVVKIDSAGNIEWQNTIRGDAGDHLNDISQTIDGGYILGGSSSSDFGFDKTENSLGNFDYWVVKIDFLGGVQWQNTIGGSQSDWLSSVQQTSDGGYILGGSSFSPISGDKTEANWDSTLISSDCWIIKLDLFGNIQWQNTIGGNDGDGLSDIKQTIDGGYIFGGLSSSNISGDKTENSNGLTDYWVVKLDSVGNIQWQNAIGGSNDDVLFSLQLTSDGGLILGGSSQSNISGDKTENCLGWRDYWIIKTDSVANIQWQNTIGGNDMDFFRSVKQTSDGGYILGGNSTSNISGDKTENVIGGTGYDDYWVIRCDSIGNILWQNTIGGNHWDVLYEVQETSDGGYILGGTSGSDISGDKTENCIGAFNDYWVVKLRPDTITAINQNPNQTSNFQIFPNPTTNEFQISNFQFQKGDVIHLTDALGNTVFTKTFSSPTSDFRLLTSALFPGIYFVEIITGKEKLVRKVVKL